MTAMLPGARDAQIVDSTLTVVGGDVYNYQPHGSSEPSKHIWTILRLVPNFRRIYQDMLSKATPGTGMWLVRGDKFRVWLEPNGDIKIFWGSGIPGAGKTLLASIIIKHLEALRQRSDATVCICYIYFRYSDRSEVTVRDILESLVKQTLERHPGCLSVIDETYAQHLREGTEPTEAQLLGLLRELAGGMSCTFYILDALDEAPTRVQLAVVKALASLDVKLFITSRPLEPLQAHFPQAYTFAIIAQETDLDLHIAKGIDESVDLQRMLEANPSLRDEIFSTIKQNCGGMFLHASLQLDALCECANAYEVRQRLKGFPSSIEDFYLETWHRICKQNAHYASLAKTVLVWVLNASRSMTVKELEHAVATCPDTYKFKPDRLVHGTTLMSLCRGLITVEEESRIVHLVHYTTKQTMENLLHESFPHPYSLLAAVCMAHLTECGFQDTTITSRREFREALENDPLLGYASEAWPFHAGEALEDDDSSYRTAEFISESKAFPVLIDTWFFNILTPLHIVVLYHFPLALVRESIKGNPNVTTAICQHSPLMMASESGHEDLVAHLIALSAIEANLVDTLGQSALMLAARKGHEGIIKLLLAHPKLQVNLVNNYGQSALMLAAREGHEGVVKLLLAHPEIQVNLVDKLRWSELMWAARKGHEGVVKLLLAQPEIQVNLVNKYGWPALMWAASEGHEGIAKLLLAHPKIQVNLVNEDGWSALMWAASEGHEGVAKLLLAHPEIQVNLVDEDGWSALMWAVSEGHEDITKLLLAQPEIQVNLVEDNGCSALMLAVSEGHKGVAKLLLVHPKIQVNLVNEDGCSALMWAAIKGHEGIAKLLLAHPEIQVKLVDEDGWSALMWSASEGHKGVAKLLLVHPEIQVNLVDEDGWSALMWAVNEGHKDIAKLLLAHPEIQVNLVDEDGWSALMWAASEGHEGVAKLLLAHPEIRVNLVNKLGWSALQLAAFNGHPAAVECLLTANDIDINAFNTYGDTAVKMAAKRGHITIVHMLLNVPNINIMVRSTTDGHSAMSAAQVEGHKDIVKLLQAFESRKNVMASPLEISQLSFHYEDGSDSDSEALYDAEEGGEEDGTLGSPKSD